MLQKHIMWIVFCFLIIFIGGCTKINIKISFQDIQTCQNFCDSVNILWGEKKTPCHETCQKLEDSKDKIIEPTIKKIQKKTNPIIIPETLTPEDCNSICTNLWKSKNQEKANCLVSCTNEITK